MRSRRTTWTPSCQGSVEGWISRNKFRRGIWAKEWVLPRTLPKLTSTSTPNNSPKTPWAPLPSMVLRAHRNANRQASHQRKRHRYRSLGRITKCQVSTQTIKLSKLRKTWLNQKLYCIEETQEMPGTDSNKCWREQTLKINRRITRSTLMSIR